MQLANLECDSTFPFTFFTVYTSTRSIIHLCISRMNFLYNWKWKTLYLAIFFRQSISSMRLTSNTFHNFSVILQRPTTDDSISPVIFRSYQPFRWAIWSIKDHRWLKCNLFCSPCLVSKAVGWQLLLDKTMSAFHSIQVAWFHSVLWMNTEFSSTNGSR